ncbi:acetyl-CoA carboxylase carboxyl transferase subunit alpha [Clostridiales Family XIII bacterium PM5-7]
MKISEKTAAQRVKLARMPGRPTAREYIDAIFDDFFPLSGDRKNGDDESVLGGLAFFHGVPVTIIGHQKGVDLEENVKYRFGMPNPEGYRKAERLMLQAEKFHRPVITFVDTPGAYPGLEAEQRGQGEAIARSIATMSRLSVPTISVFIGEGGSGGALAIGVADKTIMLENSIFSILSPEGFASILWKDASRWEEACEVMKLTATDLQKLGICDVVIAETKEGAHEAREYIFDAVEKTIEEQLTPLLKVNGQTLMKDRYKKLRNVGNMKRKVER